MLCVSTFSIFSGRRLATAASVAAVSVFGGISVISQTSNMIPERAIVLTGDVSAVHDGVVAVLYNNPEFEFHDPSDPRFLFLDRKGTIALGIGGYVYASVSCDFKGSIDGPQFVTYDIPVPADPARRSGLQFDASHSTVFLQLAGHSDRLGTYSAYVQTNFSGGKGGSHDLRLKQAYVTVGNVTVGLARSTFVDPAAPPDLDTQGPGARLSRKNILVRYSAGLGRDWQIGVGAESPASASYTVADGRNRPITQRVPDFPAYVQYGWGGQSHLRLSGMVRTLSYRDLVSGTNRYATGWGVQLSGQAEIGRSVMCYYEAYYGRGIASYVNDLDGNGYDLVSRGGDSGRMKTPGVSGLVGGLKWDFCKRAYASASYGLLKLYGGETAGADAFGRSSYLDCNLVYTIFPDCQLGVEYIFGNRFNQNGRHSKANRLMAAIKYSF